MTSVNITDDSDLLKSVQEGNSSAEESLVLKYTPLVYSLTRNCFRDGYERSDFVQEGLIGLLYAIRNYDSSRGHFSAFASECIKNKIYSALRHTISSGYIPQKLFVSISDPDNPNAETLIPPSEADGIQKLLDEAEAVDYYNRLSKLCSPVEKKVLSAWLRGYSPQETANALGKEKKSVDNAIFRIKRKASSLSHDSLA